ncbi:MAG: hypothetical protein V2A73_09060 [Pseudomonadota bacterium]
MTSAKTSSTRSGGSATPPVGADIEALCGKCGDSWHVVVAKVGERIAKVQCNRCGGQHRFRPPPGTEAAVAGKKEQPKSAATAGKTAGGGAGGKGRRAPAKLVVEPVADMSRPIRGYSAAESYQTGDRIRHPKFGAGVAGESPGPGKIAVSFSDGVRILAQAKAALSLQRPTIQPSDEESAD